MKILLPADISFMMVLDEYLPFIDRCFFYLGANTTVCRYDFLGPIAAIHVCAGIGRVFQHAKHPFVDKSAPDELTFPHPTVCAFRKQ